MGMGKWYQAKKEKEFRLSEEAGQAAVLEFLNFYGVELEFARDAEESADKSLDAMRDYYRMGLLENKHDESLGFCVVQHLVSGQTLTYREMKGSDRLAADRFDAKTQLNEKANAILGKLSGLGDDAIMMLMRDDRKAAVLVATVFFFV
ncbi:MAG: hypothetical protein LBK08_10345 [Treponema sp.]|jgi:hypothetical protein|nr:hypothetical protein [Treponema sp.]